MNKRKIKYIERRKNYRIPMSISARLMLSNDIIIPGKTQNVSFGGTFLEFDNIPVVSLADYYSIELFSRVEFTVKVIHIADNGIGFQFDFILIKYYEHFKKKMLLNAPDPDRLIKELGRQANDKC